MAILTRPASVQKNVAGSFTIDYAEVAALSVVPEGYYKNTNNWKEVFLKLKHDDSKQYGTVQFILPGTTADLITSETSRSGNWGIDSILIRDYDKGEIVVRRSDIPDVANYDLLVVSAATHGDLNIGNGENVEIPSGGKRQYGDLVVASGGTLKLADGGGITELEVLGNCRIDGVVLANNGKHLTGTWNSTSVLGDTLTHAITQVGAGVGGSGEGDPVYNYGSATLWFQYGNEFQHQGGSAIQVGDKFTYSGSGTVYTISSFNGNTGAVSPNYHSGGGPFSCTMTRAMVGGDGGLNDEGNGGGGGRSFKFGALGGSAATEFAAGVGAGQDDPAADEYGEDGVHSVSQSEAGSGGFRGMHGQGIFIKARRIDGIGTINASGQKGGDGGNGAEYDSAGTLFANGAGGGAAGGCGGNIWLRYKSGTPSLTLNVAAGERGTAGTNISGAGTATHGQAGSVGSTDSQSYS